MKFWGRLLPWVNFHAWQLHHGANLSSTGTCAVELWASSKTEVKWQRLHGPIGLCVPALNPSHCGREKKSEKHQFKNGFIEDSSGIRQSVADFTLEQDGGGTTLSHLGHVCLWFYDFVINNSEINTFFPS